MNERVRIPLGSRTVGVAVAALLAVGFMAATAHANPRRPSQRMLDKSFVRDQMEQQLLALWAAQIRIFSTMEVHRNRFIAA